jgi:bifunctional non-homologous end joining protein LigD
MLPYMKDRPQTLNRHPHGINGQRFYQKNVKGKVPEWVETFPYYSETDAEEKNFWFAPMNPACFTSLHWAASK